MHTLWLLSGLAVAWALLLIARPLARHRSRTVRVASALALLALIPVSSLTVAIGTLFMVGQQCFGHSARWDQVSSLSISTGLIAYFAYAMARGLERRLAVWRVVRTLPAAEHPALAAALSRLAPDRPIAVRRLQLDRPVAFVAGLWRPAIVLSDWLLDRLDPAELEAVIAHELAHARRKDTAIAALAGLWARYFPLAIVRDLRQAMIADIELAADRWAAIATGKPLALASALAKFWRFGSPLDLSLAGVAQLGGPEQIEQRIASLMRTGPAPRSSGDRDLPWAFGAVTAVSLALVVVLGILPSWAMARDHSVLCRIDVPAR